MELHEHELYYIQGGRDATKYSVLHYSYYLTKHPFFKKKNVMKFIPINLFIFTMVDDLLYV